MALAHFAGAGQVDVPPDRAFGLIAELFVTVGEPLARRCVGRVGEHAILGQIGGPAVIAGGISAADLFVQRLFPAKRANEQFCLFDGGPWIEIGRDAIIPAHVAIIDGLGIVADGPVEFARRPVRAQCRRQFEPFGNFCRGLAQVHPPHRLVVNIFIGVALMAEIGLDGRVAEARPMVGGEQHIGLFAPQALGFGQIAGPRLGIAHLGTAQGLDIVERRGGGLGGAQRLQ